MWPAKRRHRECPFLAPSFFSPKMHADEPQDWQAFDGLTQHWRSVLGEVYMEVHYQDLFDDLQTQARCVVAHCGSPWDPACLASQENQAPVATASSVQVCQPLYRTSVDRWRKLHAELAPVIDWLELAV